MKPDETGGAPATVAIGGVVCAGGGLWFLAVLPALRGPARQLLAAQEMSAGAPPAGALVQPDDD